MDLSKRMKFQQSKRTKKDPILLILSRFTYLLLYIILQIGQILRDQLVPNRSFLTYDRFANRTFIPTSNCPTASLVIQSIENSHLIDHGYKSLLISSMNYFYDQNE